MKGAAAAVAAHHTQRTGEVAVGGVRRTRFEAVEVAATARVLADAAPEVASSAVAAAAAVASAGAEGGAREDDGDGDGEGMDED